MRSPATTGIPLLGSSTRQGVAAVRGRKGAGIDGGYRWRDRGWQGPCRGCEGWLRGPESEICPPPSHQSLDSCDNPLLEPLHRWRTPATHHHHLKPMFDSSERQYLLEHFRVQYHACLGSERPGSAEAAETWAKLQQLFVSEFVPGHK